MAIGDVPQLTLPEPNDCIFVILSKVFFADALFRDGCGSPVNQGKTSSRASWCARKEG